MNIKSFNLVLMVLGALLIIIPLTIWIIAINLMSNFLFYLMILGFPLLIYGIFNNFNLSLSKKIIYTLALTIILVLVFIFLLWAFFPPINYALGLAPEEVALKVECLNLGGDWIPCETLSGYACSMPTSDGGMPCSDSSECEQECITTQDCAIGESVQGECASATHLVCDGIILVENGLCGATVIS